MAKKLSIIPDRAVSPELHEMREELGILHEIFAALGSAQMRASEWRRAQTVLDYVNEKIEVLQVKADHLTKLEEVP